MKCFAGSEYGAELMPNPCTVVKYSLFPGLLMYCAQQNEPPTYLKWGEQFVGKKKKSVYTLIHISSLMINFSFLVYCLYLH